MAIRNIVVEGDEILRKIARPVPQVTDRIKMTMEDMLETMREQMGVGIAAPQVGIMRRMFIAEPEPGEVYFMINPEITEMLGMQKGPEGCLSVPGMIGDVDRAYSIKMTATDLEGETHEYEFEGFHARVMQHEFDHLNGILYIDKAQNMRMAENDDEDEEDVEYEE